MSVEDSESRRFELNIRMSFSEAGLGPTSAPDFVFRGFPKVWNFPFGESWAALSWSHLIAHKVLVSFFQGYIGINFNM